MDQYFKCFRTCLIKIQRMRTDLGDTSKFVRPSVRPAQMQQQQQQQQQQVCSWWLMIVKRRKRASCLFIELDVRKADVGFRLPFISSGILIRFVTAIVGNKNDDNDNARKTLPRQLPGNKKNNSTCRKRPRGVLRTMRLTPSSFCRRVLNYVGTPSPQTSRARYV